MPTKLTNNAKRALCIPETFQKLTAHDLHNELFGALSTPLCREESVPTSRACPTTSKMGLPMPPPADTITEVHFLHTALGVNAGGTCARVPVAGTQDKLHSFGIAGTLPTGGRASPLAPDCGQCCA